MLLVPQMALTPWLSVGGLQDKKKAEEERQKELNELFALAIKQPKVGSHLSPCASPLGPPPPPLSHTNQAAIFRLPLVDPCLQVPAGVDPKSIVCEYYRHGQCTKGFKCKFR